MNNSPFASELANLRTSFNTVFGNRPTINIKARQSCLFAILHLHIIQQEIARHGNNALRLNAIREFRKKFELLNTFFNQQKEVILAKEKQSTAKAA